MASTLDVTLQQIQSDLKLATTRAVHGGVANILQGRKIDPNVITDITGTVISKAMGGILNKATQSVNNSIAKALGKTFKNSALNVIAGNYAAGILTQIITGRQTAGITAHMTTAITDGISRELYMRLPSAVTKNIKIDVLGTTFSTGLSAYVGQAVNATVGAVVTSVFSSGATSATKLTIPGTNLGLTIPSLPVIDLSNIPAALGASLGTSLGNVTASLTKIAEGLGATVNTITSSLAALGTVSISDLKLPEGLDMTRFTNGSSGVGKLIEMSSTPIGNSTGKPGLSKSQFTDVQSQMVASNINNPLGRLGGVFDTLTSTITGTTTTSGTRGITKDLTAKFDDINIGCGVLSDADKKTLEAVSNNTVEMNKAAAKNAVTKAANFKAASNDQLEKLTTVKEGFKDPNAKYPLPDYSNRTETNKLSTGDTENTIVDKKNADRMMGAQLPNGESWNQPVSPYAAQYPYNHVRETESGHVIELDDTPGSERIHMFHKSGSFMEVDAIGNKVNVIKGSDYTIIDANGYISIQGKANVSVNGSINVFVGADANIEVGGNTVVNCHNNMELNAAGRLKLTAGEGIDMKSPEIYIDADTHLQVNADVSARLHVKELDLIVDTDMKVDVKNDYRMTVEHDADTKVKGITKHYSIGEFHVNCDASIYNNTQALYHIKATNNIMVTSGAEYNLKTTGNIKETSGAEIHVKSSGVTNLSSGGDFNIKSSASLFSSSASNYHIKAGSAAFITASGNINNVAGGMILESGTGWVMSTGSGIMSANGGNMSLNTSGIIAMDASDIHLNSGLSATSGPQPTAATAAAQASASSEATQAQVAKNADALETEYSDTHYITGRKSKGETVIADSFVKPHTANKVVTSVMDSIMNNSGALSDAIKVGLMEDHGVNPASIEKTPIIIEEAKNISSLINNTVIIPDELPLGDVVMPANYKLSPYFTVGSFTTDTVNTSVLEPIGDVMTVSKIVTNLQYMALNILEPIYAARPDLVVNIGFQPIKDTQEKYVRYNFGLAVALDFKNANSFDDYYEIANIIRQIIPFDEINLIYMSADFTNSHTDSGLIVINSPGVFYPDVTKMGGTTAETIGEWVDTNNRKILKTWYNGKFINTNNLVKVA